MIITLLIGMERVDMFHSILTIITKGYCLNMLTFSPVNA